MIDERLRYRLWKEKLGSLQAQHARDDSDLALASELWATYDVGPGNNLKVFPFHSDVWTKSAVPHRPNASCAGR